MTTPKKRYLLRQPPFQKVFTSNVKRKNVDVTGSTIVLDWESLSEVVFVGTNASGVITAINGNRTISVANTGNAIKGTFSFSLSTTCAFTMPGNFYMSGNLDWNDSTKVLNLYPGKYLIHFTNDSANFQLTLDGPQ
jgi:hypothetical protein